MEDVAGTPELFVPILEHNKTEMSSDDEPLAIKKRKLCKVMNHSPRSDDTSVNCSSIPELNNKFKRAYAKTVPRIPKWTQNVCIQYSEMNCLSENNFKNVTCQLYGKTVVVIFKEFFSQDIVGHIVQQSMLYLTADELRSFGRPIWTRTLSCTNKHSTKMCFM